jgi:hypothetical protein
MFTPGTRNNCRSSSFPRLPGPTMQTLIWSFAPNGFADGPTAWASKEDFEISPVESMLNEMP